MKDTYICDNNMVTIGMCFTVPNPKAIKTFMADNIAHGITIVLVIVHKYHEVSYQFHIMFSIVKNSTLTFLSRG